MKSYRSLAALNRLRSLLAVASGATAVGISLVGDGADAGPVLMQRTLLTVLWLYVAITAVPWTNVTRMARLGVKFKLGMVAWGGYLAVVTAWLVWSVTSHPAWRAEHSAAPQTATAPHVAATPALADAGLLDRPAPTGAAAVPEGLPNVVVAVDVPAPADVTHDAPVEAAAVTDAGSAAPEDARSARRHHRHGTEPEGEGHLPPPVVWLERDPATPAR